MTKIKKAAGKCNKNAEAILTFAPGVSYNHSHHPEREEK